ncbi:hypothetical protein [Flavobacterium sp. 3HN19-14]|uniref:hypothetical protein n=1 Tax=Flavobacterium sp. 3HN19-14 TaxID=3448133 RepID=UPI003EE22C28
MTNLKNFPEELDKCKIVFRDELLKQFETFKEPQTGKSDERQNYLIQLDPEVSIIKAFKIADEANEGKKKNLFETADITNIRNYINGNIKKA